MPALVPPAVPDGRIAGTQPTLVVDDELALRPWRGEDAPRVRQAYADPATQRWHARRLDTDADAVELIRAWRAGWVAATEIEWAVVDRDDRVLGRVGLKHLDRQDGVAEVVYWTHPDARGRGVAPRALAAVTPWALDEIGFHRLELEHSTANPASCRVADKTGFVAEGVRRSAARHLDGWHDMHVHVRLGPTSSGSSPGQS